MKTVFILLGLLAGAFLFYKFPDLDISILGLGAHRNFLFHSFFIVLVVFLLSLINKKQSLVSLLINSAVFDVGIGIGFHLFQDGFQSHPVKFPFIGSLVDGTSLDDRIWLFSNSILSFAFSIGIYLRNRKYLAE